MCFGPIKVSGNAAGRIIISNSIDIIELSYLSAWRASRNYFYFKFHITESFDAGPDSIIYFTFPFKTRRRVSVSYPRPEYNDYISRWQADFVQEARKELVDTPGLIEEICPPQKTEFDRRWIFGDPNNSIHIHKMTEGDNISDICRLLASSKWILKGPSDNFTKEKFEHTAEKFSDPNGMIISLRLKGEFPEGSCFAVRILCKDAYCNRFGATPKAEARLFYYDDDTFENEDVHEKINKLKPLKTVPCLFLQVALFSKHAFREDGIHPDFDNRKPTIIRSHGRFRSLKKKYPEGRGFVIFRPDVGIKWKNFITSWEWTLPFHFPPYSWLGWIIFLGVLGTAIGAVIHFADLINLIGDYFQSFNLNED